MQEHNHTNIQDPLLRRYLFDLPGNPIVDFRWLEHSDWKLLMLETHAGKNIALLIRPDEVNKHYMLCSRINTAINRLKAHEATRELPA